MTRHMLSMVVRRNPGVLARIVVLFSSRAVSIHSLSLEPTEQSGISRLDVAVDLLEGRQVEQLIKQLARLVDVLRVVELTSARDQLRA